MGKSPQNNNAAAKNTGERNYLATIVNESGMSAMKLDRMFAAQIRNPLLITRSKVIDKLELKKKLLGIDTSKQIAEERQKFEEVNQVILDLQEKQIRYILTELAKKAGRKPEEVDKLLENGKRDRDVFLKGIEEFQTVRNEAGQKLNTNREVLNEANKDEKPLLVSQEEINQIIRDSALVENIGAPKKEHLAMLVEDNGSNNRSEAYRESITKSVLQQTGYSEKELDEAFRDAFGLYGASIDYDLVNDARKELLKNRMSALPESQQNEQSFVEESEKLDLAMRAYVFPHADIKEFDEKKAFCGMTKDEYQKFAIDTTRPTAVAREVAGHFSAMLDGIADREDLEGAAAYIKHLENIHKARPFWTRFADYFKSSGEDSTIKRMKKQLYKTNFTKEEVDNAIKNTKYAYMDVSIENRFRALNSDKTIRPVWKPAEEIADNCVNAIETNEQLRQQIAQERKINGQEKAPLIQEEKQLERETELDRETEVNKK